MIADKYKTLAIGLLGILLALLGCVYMIFWDSLFHIMINKLLILRPNEPITNLWQSPPLKLTIDFYLFNWTNPDDFYKPKINPKFNEVGPYRFIEQTEKVKLNWHPQNASLTYRKKSIFHFNPEGSIGPLKDKITIMNILTIGVIYKSRYWNPIKRSLLNLALSMYGNEVTMNTDLDHILFKGVEDSRVDLANALPFQIPDLEIPFDKFGFCYERNNSDIYSGIFNIFTGIDDLNKLGQVHTWNYATTSKVASKCGSIQASPGEFQTPFLKENEDLMYFISDFCRKVKVEYLQKADVKGVEGFEYIGGLKSFDNGTYDKASDCYCKEAECLPSGTINISSCWYNFPLFISFPHFYNADPVYLEQVDGLMPDKGKHELKMTLEPTTGLLLEMKARLQLNLLVDPLQHSVVTRNAKRRTIPLVWVDYRMQVPDSDLQYFRIINIVKYCGRLLGLIPIVAGLLLIFCYPIKKHWRQNLIRHIDINTLTIGQHDGKLSVSLQRERSPLLTSLARSRQILIKSLSMDSEKDLGFKSKLDICSN